MTSYATDIVDWRNDWISLAEMATMTAYSYRGIRGKLRVADNPPTMAKYAGICLYKRDEFERWWQTSRPKHRKRAGSEDRIARLELVVADLTKRLAALGGAAEVRHAA